MSNKYIYVFTTAMTLTTLSMPSELYAFPSIAYAGDAPSSSTIKNVIPDTVITAAIKSDYLADSRIKALSIHVETVNGKVMLTGTVPNYDIKQVAESIAKNTNGVGEVINKLEITDASKDVKAAVSDTAITAAIKSKYLADSAVKSLNIHVETVNGKVTLTGDVPNEEAKKNIELIAKDIEGVKEVINKTHIR